MMIYRPHFLFTNLFLSLSLWLCPIAFARIRYVPPSKPSAPQGTIPWTTRGVSCNLEQPGELIALAPLSHVGQTISKRPTFVWYMPDRTSYRLEFRLFHSNGQHNGQRIYKTEMPSQAGVMRFSLPADQPELSVGQYRWQVVLLCSPSTPSLNVVTAAEIAVVNPTPALQTQLAASKTPQQQIDHYASNGLWYDALALAASTDTPQSQPNLANLLNALVDVEVQNSKDWSDRLRQVTEILR